MLYARHVTSALTDSATVLQPVCNFLCQKGKMNTTINILFLLITPMFYARLFSVIWTSPETGHYLSYQTKTQAQVRADLYLFTPYVPTWRLLVFGYTSSKLYKVKKLLPAFAGVLTKMHRGSFLYYKEPFWSWFCVSRSRDLD
jgi:hypothetical protein